MKSHQKYLFSLLVCAFGACTPKYDLKMPNNASLSNPKLIEGSFKNLITGTGYISGSDYFWKHIQPFNIDEKQTYKDAIVKIIILDDKKIEFSLLLNNQIIEKKILKYKFVNNRIVITNNEKWWGVPMVLYRYIRHDLNIAINDEKSLSLLCEGFGVGGIFILAPGGDFSETFTMQRAE